MSYSDQYSQLRGRLNSIVNSSYPICWPNVTFTPPNPPARWIEFQVVDGEGFQLTIGAGTNNHRFPGVLYIKIYEPLNGGDGDVMTYADTLAAGFRNWKGTSVVCREASVKAVGKSDKHDNFYQVNVVVPFKRDELL